MLVGVSGKINSGKDLIGQLINYIETGEEKTYTCLEGFLEFYNDAYLEDGTCLYPYEIKKFADKLKDIVCLLIGCTREQLEDREFKEKELGEEWWYYKGETGLFPYNTPYEANKKLPLIKTTPRLLLQLLGTNCGRNIIHPNIWCNALFSEYHGDIEIWKDIVGYEGLYQISNFGNVKSLDRTIVYGENKGQYHCRKGQILKPSYSNEYQTVGLSGKTFTIHSLVANAFIEKFESNLIINHKDGNKSNNFYKNLEWITQKENIQNSIKTTNGNIGSNQKDAKLNDILVIEIKKLLEEKELSQSKIAKLYGVSPTTISEIKTGKKWKHIGENSSNIINITPILPVKTPNWIITDVRFPNEAEAIKARGGIVIRVNRPCKECGGMGYHKMDCNIGRCEHESEYALDKYEYFDHIIDNDGTIKDLLQKVKNII